MQHRLNPHSIVLQKAYLGKREDVQISSCGDCIVKFPEYTGLVLAPVTVNYSTFSITRMPVTLPISPLTETFSNICFECSVQLLGGFFSQQSLDSVEFTSTIVNADSLVWDFGDGAQGGGSNPVHAYGSPGNYTVCLTGYSACDTLDTCQVISVLVGLEKELSDQFEVFPVPAEETLFITGGMGEDMHLRLMDLQGKLVFQKDVLGAGDRISLNVAGLPSGMYWLEIVQNKGRVVKQVEVVH